MENCLDILCNLIFVSKNKVCVGGHECYDDGTSCFHNVDFSIFGESILKLGRMVPRLRHESQIRPSTWSDNDPVLVH